ncbi:MAG TPA: hypothetical protein PK286_04130 [Devosia sp.]|nr:hypothetical protein [Devosia sp.]
MSFQKLQSKGIYSNFTIKPEDIDETQAPMPAEAGEGWQLLVINNTNHELVFAAVAQGASDFGPWFSIPAVGNNCPTGFDLCFDRQQWTAVLSLLTVPPPFSLRLATKTDSFGVATGAEFLDISPEPGTSGGVIGIDVQG